MGLSQAKQGETDYASSMLSFDIEETDSNIECALTIVASVTPTGWQ